ncbi:MAG TPA: NADP-dependent oxidoreductase [Solirubrobacteraceae bacterium]|nr:NADP-dependent oxidoreductase [Solirubrobacteraceae bacterium]
MIRSREVQLAARPVGEPKPSDFKLAETEVPDPEEGQLLVRNGWMSVDPYMRGRMNDVRSYVAPFQVGAPLDGGAVGVVVKSGDTRFAEGQWVLHQLGWRELALVGADAAQPIDPDLAPPSVYLGVLGMPGLTAYVGLFDIAALKDGETVFVSGAAGAVGSTAGQLAKVHGCRVIGSAGSAEKVAYLVDELGFDAAFNYRDGPAQQLLREAAPDGIDVYFDNVGGDQLEAALMGLRLHGRVAMCGAISMYNATEPPPGPRTLPRAVPMRLTLRGFIVSDHFDRMPAFRQEVGALLRDGRISYRETVVDGLEHAVDAFIGLLRGENLGKMVVRLQEGI